MKILRALAIVAALFGGAIHAQVNMAPLGPTGGAGGGGSPTGAAGGALTGTYPNPGVNLGAGASVTGVTPVANGGVPQGAWTTFTPSASCGTATYNVNSARWQQIAPKTTVVEYDITISAIGTCTSASVGTTLNLPNTAASATGTTVRDFIAGGVLSCNIESGSAVRFNCITPAGLTSVTTNSRFTFTLTYENT